MVRLNEVRRNEVAVEAPASFDAGLTFIGVIRTPWTSRLDCPRQGRADGPICRIEVAEPWVAALDGIEAYERIEVLYWLHESRRDLVRQSPANDGETRGTFSLRSPVRPNPIGTALATLVSAKGRRSWSGVSTASIGRRSSTSSPIAASSRRSPRLRRAISRRGERPRSWRSGAPAFRAARRFAFWTDFVWASFLAAGRDVGPVDAFRFSWRVAVSLRTPRS